MTTIKFDDFLQDELKQEDFKAGYLAEEVKTPQRGQYKIEVKDTGSGAKSIVVTNPDKVQ